MDHLRWGKLKIHIYESEPDNEQHIVLIFGTLQPGMSVPVRVQTMGGNNWGTQLFSDSEQMTYQALDQLAGEKVGVFVGLSIPEITASLSAQIEQLGVDVPRQIKRSQLREYGIGAQILVDLGLKDIQLLTNHPRRLPGLEGYGLVVTDTLSIAAQESPVGVKAVRVLPR